jgi:hypothetical protein
MKTLILSFALIPLLAFVDLPNLSEISKAINDGNADALAPFLDSSVEIAILDSEDVYTKSEAVKRLKTFFEQSKPKSFSQVHQGTSKGQDSQYCIGNLVATSGTFRVYIYLKVAGGKTLIQEMRFDRS